MQFPLESCQLPQVHAAADRTGATGKPGAQGCVARRSWQRSLRVDDPGPQAAPGRPIESMRPATWSSNFPEHGLTPDQQVFAGADFLTYAAHILLSGPMVRYSSASPTPRLPPRIASPSSYGRCMGCGQRAQDASPRCRAGQHGEGEDRPSSPRLLHSRCPWAAGPVLPDTEEPRRVRIQSHLHTL